MFNQEDDDMDNMEMLLTPKDSSNSRSNARQLARQPVRSAIEAEIQTEGSRPITIQTQTQTSIQNRGGLGLNGGQRLTQGIAVTTQVTNLNGGTDRQLTPQSKTPRRLNTNRLNERNAQMLGKGPLPGGRYFFPAPAKKQQAKAEQQKIKEASGSKQVKFSFKDIPTSSSKKVVQQEKVEVSEPEMKKPSKHRVTFDLKDIIQMSTENNWNEPQPKIEQPEIQKNNIQNIQASQQIEIEQPSHVSVGQDFLSSQNLAPYRNRITLDIRQIGQLLQNNVNAYQKLTQDKQKNNNSKRMTVYSRFSSGAPPQTPQQAQLYDFLQQALNKDKLQKQKQEVQAMLERMKERDRESLERLQMVRGLKQKVMARCSQPTIEWNYDTNEVMQVLQEYLKETKYFQFHYKINVIDFQIKSSQSRYLVKMILDKDLYITLKKNPNQVPTIDIFHDARLAFKPHKEWLVLKDMRMGMLVDYFEMYLTNLQPYAAMQRLGQHYMRLLDLQIDLTEIQTLFNIKKIYELPESRKLSFSINPFDWIQVNVTVDLVRLEFPDFVKFSNEQTGQMIDPNYEQSQEHGLLAVLANLIVFLTPE